MRSSSITFSLALLSVVALASTDARGYVFDGNMCAEESTHIPSSPNLMVFADRSSSMLEPSELGQQEIRSVDPTFQGSIDIGLQLEPAHTSDNPQNRPGLSLSQKVVVPPYAWVANHTNSTVSKFNMETKQEEGRFSVGNNPSRTAVDLDGNAWITTRSSGTLTKILWNSAECPDKNGDGVITTSTGTNVVANDECIVYQAIPRPGWTMRGVAAGPDGRVWIGYSNTGGTGAIQSINSSTFELGPIVMASGIPLYRPDASGVFTRTGTSTVSGCDNYGLVLDSQGLLYYSTFCRDRLPVYNTRTEQWVAAYQTPNINAFYGVAVDAERRVWIGGWPDITGVRMFDPDQLRMHYFPTTGNHQVTGVAAEPGTGDIWASFYNTGYTGRLRFNETNYSQFTWTMIPTTKQPNSTSNLSGVGNDLRGVGFDIHGNAWTLGLGSNRIFMIDPATNQRHADLPIGKAVGVGSHYTYSDFTGSTALSFTAPSGKWSHIYNTQDAQVLSITLEAHVPFGTSVGLRYRSVDVNGNPTSPWSPATVGGTEAFHQYPSASGCVGVNCQATPSPPSMTVQIPQPNDNPFVPGRLELEVRLGTSDKGIRPYLYAVTLETNPVSPLFANSQNVAADMSNTFSIDGECTGDDGSGCDVIRVGLAYFTDTVDIVTEVGENTSAAISDGITNATPGGLTGATLVARQIRDMASLQSPDRSNFALIITDGKFNTRNDVIAAIGYLCDANRRATAPVATYMMGPGDNTDMQMNGLLAAAGGTGSCCPSSSLDCLNQPVDVCSMSNDALAAALNQTGSSPYSQTSVNPAVLSCSGALEMTDITLFKNNLRKLSNELACTFKLHIPDDPNMYNNPEYPQIGALANPASTRVRLDHTNWSLLDVPYCEPGDTDCGFEESLTMNGVAASTAASFADEGWYFASADRSQIRLTDGLCNQIAQRKVKTTRTQVACQCRFEGEACDTGLLGRCSVGRYACDEGVDTCVQVFRPMPETCNGLDDNCDGKVDNLSQSGADWTQLGGVPDQYIGIQCSLIDVCICPTQGNQHAGSGATAEAEFSAFLAENWNNGCYCGEGLAMSHGDSFASPSIHQSGGCAVQPGSENGGLVLGLLGLALLWVRRR